MWNNSCIVFFYQLPMFISMSFVHSTFGQVFNPLSCLNIYFSVYRVLSRVFQLWQFQYPPWSMSVNLTTSRPPACLCIQPKKIIKLRPPRRPWSNYPLWLSRRRVARSCVFVATLSASDSFSALAKSVWSEWPIFQLLFIAIFVSPF